MKNNRKSKEFNNDLKKMRLTIFKKINEIERLIANRIPSVSLSINYLESFLISIFSKNTVTMMLTDTGWVEAVEDKILFNSVWVDGLRRKNHREIIFDKLYLLMVLWGAKLITRPIISHIAFPPKPIKDLNEIENDLLLSGYKIEKEYNEIEVGLKKFQKFPFYITTIFLLLPVLQAVYYGVNDKSLLNADMLIYLMEANYPIAIALLETLIINLKLYFSDDPIEKLRDLSKKSGLFIILSNEFYNKTNPYTKGTENYVKWESLSRSFILKLSASLSIVEKQNICYCLKEVGEVDEIIGDEVIIKLNEINNYSVEDLIEKINHRKEKITKLEKLYENLKLFITKQYHLSNDKFEQFLHINSLIPSYSILFKMNCNKWSLQKQISLNFDGINCESDDKGMRIRFDSQAERIVDEFIFEEISYSPRPLKTQEHKFFSNQGYEEKNAVKNDDDFPMKTKKNQRSTDMSPTVPKEQLNIKKENTKFINGLHDIINTLSKEAYIKEKSYYITVSGLEKNEMIKKKNKFLFASPCKNEHCQPVLILFDKATKDKNSEIYHYAKDNFLTKRIEVFDYHGKSNNVTVRRLFCHWAKKKKDRGFKYIDKGEGHTGPQSVKLKIHENESFCAIEGTANIFPNHKKKSTPISVPVFYFNGTIKHTN